MLQIILKFCCDVIFYIVEINMCCFTCSSVSFTCTRGFYWSFKHPKNVPEGFTDLPNMPKTTYLESSKQRIHKVLPNNFDLEVNGQLLITLDGSKEIVAFRCDLPKVLDLLDMNSSSKT